MPPPPGSAYGATKAYVASFSESLHSEVAGKGVHVTALRLVPRPLLRAAVNRMWQQAADSR